MTMSKGRVVFELNDGEKHELKQGDVMRFDGADFISGKAAEASEFVVTLIKGKTGGGTESGHDHHHHH